MYDPSLADQLAEHADNIRWDAENAATVALLDKAVEALGEDNIAIVDMAAYIVSRRREGLALAERLAAWADGNDVKCIADTIEYLRREE
jgi:hypothetical protein